MKERLRTALVIYAAFFHFPVKIALLLWLSTIMAEHCQY